MPAKRKTSKESKKTAKAVVTSEDKEALLKDLKESTKQLGRLPRLMLAPVLAFVAKKYDAIPKERRKQLQKISNDFKKGSSSAVENLKAWFQGMLRHDKKAVAKKAKKVATTKTTKTTKKSVPTFKEKVRSKATDASKSLQKNVRSTTKAASKTIKEKTTSTKATSKAKKTPTKKTISKKKTTTRSTTRSSKASKKS